jgi:hypothetical protein
VFSRVQISSVLLTKILKVGTGIPTLVSKVLSLLGNNGTIEQLLIVGLIMDTASFCKGLAINIVGYPLRNQLPHTALLLR